jgi:hypothetical protein
MFLEIDENGYPPAFLIGNELDAAHETIIQQTFAVVRYGIVRYGSVLLETNSTTVQQRQIMEASASSPPRRRFRTAVQIG